MYYVSPPDSEGGLYQRAVALSHQELGILALAAHIPIPADLRRDKGWIGVLLEHCLGAYSGNKPQQDFPQLGIELKTIPVDINGRPLESTFVCVAPLIGNNGIEWRNSPVWHKLQRVLWVPIVGARRSPLTKRRVGIPLLWSPNEAEEAQLKQDWEELMDLIILGQVEQITARQGQILQLRPKAANGRAKTAAIGAQGQPILTLPRGFYLKTAFTARLLANPS